jgi:hypothetical protein
MESPSKFITLLGKRRARRFHVTLFIEYFLLTELRLGCKVYVAVMATEVATIPFHSCADE